MPRLPGTQLSQKCKIRLQVRCFDFTLLLEMSHRSKNEMELADLAELAHHFGKAALGYSPEI